MVVSKKTLQTFVLSIDETYFTPEGSVVAHRALLQNLVSHQTDKVHFLEQCGMEKTSF